MTTSNPPSAAAMGPPSVSRGPGAPAPAPTGPATVNALKRTAHTAFEEEPETPALVKMNATPYAPQRHINDHYDIVGFISSGTYGRVYKAVSKRPAPTSSGSQTNGHLQGPKHPATGKTIEAFAIKKFKPDKEGELQYTGISQSAIREMALCTELSHPALIHLVEIILESKCIFMVFEYAEHDLLQIIHHHSLMNRSPIPPSTLRSCLHQLLSGLLYLHQNWVIHRDLKPANIMVTSSGAIKIGDLGLARLFYKPLHALFSGDKVVVTIWYRAPELLLGSRHYTPAIDLWAVGCIFAELLSLRPIFKGEEAKQDTKKGVPFQRNQMGKIGEILGLPKKPDWPLLTAMPEYPNLQSVGVQIPSVNRPLTLEKWYKNTITNNNYPSHNLKPPSDDALDLLDKLLTYDPLRRLTAEQALKHPYFTGQGGEVSWNCFEGLETKYPARKAIPYPSAAVDLSARTKMVKYNAWFDFIQRECGGDLSIARQRVEKWQYREGQKRAAVDVRASGEELRMMSEERKEGVREWMRRVEEDPSVDETRAVVTGSGVETRSAVETTDAQN